MHLFFSSLDTFSFSSFNPFVCSLRMLRCSAWTQFECERGEHAHPRFFYFVIPVISRTSSIQLTLFNLLIVTRLFILFFYHLLNIFSYFICQTTMKCKKKSTLLPLPRWRMADVAPNVFLVKKSKK